MAAPPSVRLQSMLQTAVQTVQWTYSLFWQLCPQKRILVWSEGCYNGAIKTRKTVQPMEASAEETSLERSQQLRELYDSLSAGESNVPAQRPSAALSPEDLTESEWFYLMCISFSFPHGVGLPGKAYGRRQHVWLTGANESDSKLFSRAILAKSARIQTVVCIPLLDGVVELGTTERVQEDNGFIEHVKSFFIDQNQPQPPKPALSEHSTSNSSAPSSRHARTHSPSVPNTYVPIEPLLDANKIDQEEDEDEEEDDDDEKEEDEYEESEAEEEDEDEDEEEDEEDEDEESEEEEDVQNPRNVSQLGVGVLDNMEVEQSELMQIDMSEDIRVGSPDDGSNKLESDIHFLVDSQAGNNQGDRDQRGADSLYRAESTPRWPLFQDLLSNGLHSPPSGIIVDPALEELTPEDTHYSQTVATILQHQSRRWSDPPTSTDYAIHSTQPAFTKWSTTGSDNHGPIEVTSQSLLKYILFTIPDLHTKYPEEETSPKSRETGADPTSRRGTEEPNASHVLAERRRREKLNEKFIILRSLVPFVTKMDKASILGDTIEYVKQLRKKIQDLEEKTHQMEEVDDDHHQRSIILLDPQKSSSSRASLRDQRRAGATTVVDKRKVRIVERSGGVKSKVVDSQPQTVAREVVHVEVSIIECDALVEVQCPYREGLLLDMMQMLRQLRVEITAVQSSLNDAVLVAEMRAKVKENVKGKKASIMEVKRAIKQIIPQN